MKLSKSRMKWSSIMTKLKVGVALTDRKSKADAARRFNSDIEKIAYNSAKDTGQISKGFGEAGFVENLQSGDMIPDQLFGWSTKTVLAILLGLMLFKVKKLQGAA
jgi:hypothetical protein